MCKIFFDKWGWSYDHSHMRVELPVSLWLGGYLLLFIYLLLLLLLFGKRLDGYLFLRSWCFSIYYNRWTVKIN